LSKPRAVLFDLDGTLADTAPDLGGAVNRLRAEQGLEPLAIEVMRSRASIDARSSGMPSKSCVSTHSFSAYSSRNRSRRTW